MLRWLMPVVAVLMLVSAQPVLAAQPEQGVVRDLVNPAPPGCNNPEGIAASPDGLIYAVSPSGGRTLWAHSALLAPHGFPGFGANGVAFDRTQSFLYVANTSDDLILRIGVNTDGSAGAISIFADGAVIDATQHTT